MALWLLPRARANSTVKAALTVAAAFAPGRGQEFWPSVRSIADRSSLGDRAVRAALGHACRCGWFTIAKPKSGPRPPSFVVDLSAVLRDLDEDGRGQFDRWRQGGQHAARGVASGDRDPARGAASDDWDPARGAASGDRDAARRAASADGIRHVVPFYPARGAGKREREKYTRAHAPAREAPALVAPPDARREADGAVGAARAHLDRLGEVHRRALLDQVNAARAAIGEVLIPPGFGSSRHQTALAQLAAEIVRHGIPWAPSQQSTTAAGALDAVAK